MESVAECAWTGWLNDREIRNGMAAFPQRELREALTNMRYDHPVLQL